ncbi:hypothetical protein [Gloeothece verrucosa]|uniref:Uncharacterized protein n=1 Tax=Gloeothece verrucosa (strain PCC 7822) TaxID=497965 RepID=E0UII6_GLOV7|nr:hypothetical protein [Gloeothece verrucosa]ADN12180.1 hypothetical protein Cyan7822_0129 [Gloeothece verrucosa PCC 7822]
MARTSSVTHFVAVSDLSKSLSEQEGILIEVEGKGGNNPQNRAKALEIVHRMWEQGEIEADQFPDGLTLENLVFVPPDSPQLQAPKAPKKAAKIPPIIQGAQEIIELTRLQLEIQEIAEEAEPYLPIIKAVLEKNRPLTAKEKELVKDKKYPKTLERLGTAIATQENYRANSSGYANLILNAIAWQLNKGLKEPSKTTKPETKRRPQTRVRKPKTE